MSHRHQLLAGHRVHTLLEPLPLILPKVNPASLSAVAVGS